MVKQNKTVPKQTKSKHPIKDLLIPKKSQKKIIKVRVFSKIMKSNKREPRSKVSPLFRLESFPMHVWGEINWVVLVETKCI